MADIILTLAEESGKHIYLRGTSPSRQGITALLGKTEVPASVLTCASCHGYDGRGKPEGGVVPSNITWEALTKPYGITHPSGRHHPPYTERLLKRAITMGIDPAGNQLHVAMPRFQMSHQDLAALITYLKQLGKSLDPGLAEMSRAVRAVLEAYFDEVNQAGGIYNRRIVLRFAESLDPSEEGIKTVQTFLEKERIFALTSSFMAGADEEIAALVQDQEIPLVGAFTLDPQLRSPLNRYVFYLLDSGLKEQGRALAAFAAKQYAAKNPPTAIIHADEKTAHAVAQAIRAECQRSGWDAVEELDVSRGQFNAALLVRRLREKATEIVFFLGPSAAASVLLQETQSLDWDPILLVPGSLAGSELFAVPISFDGRIFLSFPSLPSAQTPEGMVEYQRLARARKFPSQHLATQLTALSSAKVLVGGLKRTGRDINREKLIEALEGLYEFKTGFTAAVTYGPDRRVGALGAY
ncbi:MAG: ABC transporter substrate-binding protein, partial [Acidobacteria bacterium]|nr:ABC transporter substrate-binding protein [Acidobacteriota bacterium]